MRAGIYARVSTADQEGGLQTQLQALRSYSAARGWETTTYIDRVSGADEHRPGFNAMIDHVRRRKLDVVVCTKLDRLARSVRHLVVLGQELQVLGVDLVVIDQAIDTTTPTGRLLFHVLAAIAEFERDLIRERITAGIQRAKAAGVRMGRPRRFVVDVAKVRELQAADPARSLRSIGRALGGIHPTVIKRALSAAAAQER